MQNRLGRKWIFIHELDSLQEVGESKKLHLELQTNTIHCSLYRYKNNKAVNPNGRVYSARPLGNDEYLFTLVKKGS